MTTAIAVAGAGLIGRRHIAAIDATPDACLAAIADPAPASQELAAVAGVPWFATVQEMLAAGIAQGVILATPNAAHAEGAHACIAAGCPVLVEKPLTATEEEGAALVTAARARGVPILTGHHRRHNPIIEAAKHTIESGDLGRITVIHAQAWLAKPDAYFDTAWRRRPGAGPVLVNLIHDIDLLQFLCGPIAQVHAFSSNRHRGFAVEDTATITLEFASGALGTMSISDATAAPWSWEMTSRENPAYPVTDESCYRIGGTQGALSIPDLTVWSHEKAPDWWTPIQGRRLAVDLADPLIRQVAHFIDVIAGRAEPLCSGADGLSALRVARAILRSAETGETVQPAGL